MIARPNSDSFQSTPREFIDHSSYFSTYIQKHNVYTKAQKTFQKMDTYRDRKYQ